MLIAVDLPRRLMDRPIPEPIERLLTRCDAHRQAFHDQLASAQFEQFVASDHRLVYQTLDWIGETPLPFGRRFLEWGCGFAVNACIAAQLGWDAFAVEAEAELVRQAQRTIEWWKQPVELHHGNFLPRGAERLADDPYFPSLGHAAGAVYDRIDLEIEDFAVVFTYPWPGERDFVEKVFARYAARGALLLCFRGPMEISVQQKR